MEITEVNYPKNHKYFVKNVLVHRILVEQLLRDEINVHTEEIQWYCFNGVPKLCVRIEKGSNNKTTLYDDKFNIVYDSLSIGDEQVNAPCDNFIKQSFDLTLKLCGEFKFVRVDWMRAKGKIYFEELTFSPYSGFNKTIKEKYNGYFGSLINLEGIENEFRRNRRVNK